MHVAGGCFGTHDGKAEAGTVGMLEAKNLLLGLVPWAGCCPLRGAYTTKQMGTGQLLGRLQGAPVAQGRPALGARRQPLGTRQPRAICEAGMSSFPQFLPPKPPPMLLLRPLPSPRFRVSGLIPAQECNYLSSCPRPGEYKEQTWHFRFSLLAVLLGEVRLDGVPSTGTGAWLLASPRFRFLSQTQKSEGGRVVGWCGQTASRTQHTTRRGEGGWLGEKCRRGRWGHWENQAARGHPVPGVATARITFLVEAAALKGNQGWGSDPVPGLSSVSSPWGGAGSALLQKVPCPT